MNTIIYIYAYIYIYHLNNETNLHCIKLLTNYRLKCFQIELTSRRETINPRQKTLQSNHLESMEPTCIYPI